MSEMQSKFLAANSIRLHYLDNEATCPTLLLLHGLTANAHAFDGLIAAGLGDFFRVVAVDLRGRGMSEHPQSGYGMQEHAADIIGLLDALKIESPYIAGHSFGGFLGVYLAAHYPDRVQKLVLMDAAVRMHPNAKEMLGHTLGRLGRTFTSFDSYIEHVRQAPYLTIWDEAMRSNYRADVKDNADGSVTPRSSVTQMEAVLKGALGEPWTDLIRSIAIPSMLINATEVYTLGAPLLPEELALETVSLMNDCRYVQVAGNHQTMLYGQGALQIVAAIRTFLP